MAAAIASAFMPGVSSALELGEISSRASLGQTLSANIELRGVGDLTSDDVVVSLASQQDFERLGVDRNQVVIGLRFSSDVGKNGRGVIHVSSSRPIQEPYVNFVLQVVWPQGRLVREFTLLLDPPSYVATPVSPPKSSATVPVSVASRQLSPAPVAASADTYRIQRNDALWDIASRNRPSSGVSVMQTMAAIQQLNPDAFVDGNVNRLKVGQVLRLPDEQQARAQTHAQAVARIESQNGQWNARRQAALPQGRQMDATKKSEAGFAPVSAESRDNLRLVSGSRTSVKDKADAEQLAVLQEGLDSARREGEEMRSRIADLQSQMEKLNKLVELKDAQIAGLIARLAEQDKAGKPAAGNEDKSASAATRGEPVVAAQSAEAAPQH
ncbi:LysM peptidoglycan-binding domain-containing protein [Pseudomonas sp. ZM23]|uniref:LysM peptidoglycan-binding domain-containing protein n=1 Tax=Pseudomonas triclosanedens TaxID=2961893 RepID=A0ABY6ZTB7_9PSED|nr:FimV/HubP family polar landmark protein [Pseudomonas triclosanedens]MCP8466600.1 LysM peptidoglycan-binding domain-containing protein [Pseudomonas triclosanedens]MCP8472045.1 LysM peptidoglycan-binding domain-containing protein [Pseudomonas triclosanedens]MCP8474571.1 LysM peptidoglycan-binding domain-containing protein [Pseudomonas triclosanedens]WAI48051.1 LysM peptidoglycan-binding domain-containing protein [Pseudomonas triclosanedens]